MKNMRRFVDLDSVLPKMLDTAKDHLAFHQKDFFTSEKFTEDLIHQRTYINCLLPSFPGKSWDRFLDGAHRVSTGEKRPIWLDLVVTGRCHCKCWHCFRSCYKDNSDMELSTIKRTIQEAYEMGTTVFGITGGEPMLRDDILEILQSIPDGMEGLLYTTGYKIDAAFAAELKKTNVTRCLISLDHFEKEKINEMRGYPKAYEMTMTAIEALKNANIYTGVTLCVTEDLCDEEIFFKYIDFVQKLGADEIRVVLPIPQGNLEGKNYKRLYIDAMKWTRDIRNRTLNDLNFPNILLFSNLESSDFIGCGAGFTYVTINNDGAMTPCVCVPLSFGNIKDSGLKDAYDKLSPYFKSTGKTCYGKRITKAMKEQEDKGLLVPYSYDVTHNIASKCLVDDGNAKFYENLKKLQ